MLSVQWHSDTTMAMVALTIADHPRWQASDTELRVDGPSYTTETLQRFSAAGVRPTELLSNDPKFRSRWGVLARLDTYKPFSAAASAGAQTTSAANQLLIAGREGVKACGILDFQDAVEGPVTYDLMSLLEDARRDVPAPLIAEMKQRYLAAFPNIAPPDFAVSWAVMAAL